MWMSTRLRTSCAAALLLASAPALAADKGKAKTMSDQTFTHTLSHWLVLGPVADAMPLFHEEDRGRY